MPSPVRGAVDSLANSRGRSARRLLMGVGLTAAVMLGSAIVARLRFRPPRVFAAAWPPLFLALAVSGLRIWNAPRSPARTQARMATPCLGYAGALTEELSRKDGPPPTVH